MTYEHEPVRRLSIGCTRGTERRGTTAIHTRRAVGLVMGLVAVASAQVAPVGVHHTSVGPGAGLGAPMSPTGAYATSVPLDLPPARGGVPVPLSVVYTGSARAGAAGAGWDVPLSYVRRSTTSWRR